MQNCNLKFKILLSITLLSTFYLLLSTSVWAHSPNNNNDFWTPGDKIVPCTNDCNKCELLHLSRHIIDFLMVAATPILATFFLIWAGVLIMMGGANPGMLSSGKRIFKDTIIGVLIVMLSWLIVNTLIKSLAKDVIPKGACVNNVCTNGVGACNVDDDCGTATYNWWQFSCSQAPGSGNPPPGTTVVISAVQAQVTGANTATINWTTNVPATSEVKYRPTSGVVGNPTWSTATGPSSATNHSVNLIRLASNRNYEFMAVSSGVESSLGTFTTQPAGTSGCRLSPVLSLNPDKNVYSNGERMQVSIIAYSGCNNFSVEVKVGPVVTILGSINWNQGIVVSNPVMTGPCTSSVACTVINWTANKFNSSATRYGIRAVARDGSGGSTEAFSPTFTISP